MATAVLGPNMTLEVEGIDFDRSGARPYDVALTAALTDRSTWIRDATAQLRAIMDLRAGWDSNGAEPPDPSIVTGALALLQCLVGDARVPKPHINPTPSGGVQFEWERGDRYFEIELVSPTEAHGYFADPDSRRGQCVTVRAGESLLPVVICIEQVYSR